VNRWLAKCVYWLAIGAVAALPACALLKKPVPVPQIQLAIDQAQLLWPANIAVKSVSARAILQSDRVIVTEGARVMQHSGVRWVASPAAQLQEQLSFARAKQLAQRDSNRATPAESMQMAIWLNDFNIDVLANGDTRILVSARAEIQCKADKILAPLPAVERSVPLNSASPQRIAEAFNAAAGAALNALALSAKAQCGAR